MTGRADSNPPPARAAREGVAYWKSPANANAAASGPQAAAPPLNRLAFKPSMTPRPALDDFDLHHLALRYLRERRLSPEELSLALERLEGKNPNAMLNAELTGVGAERSLLSLALSRGQWEIARALLEAGADPFLDPVERTRQDKSAPIVKALSGALDIPAARTPAARALIEALIERGALVNGAPEHPPFMIPLHLCSRFGKTPGAAGQSAFGLWAAPMLLELGADPNAADEHGQSALMICAMSDDPGMCRLLLAAGADDARADEEGETALTRALGIEAFETALALLSSPSPASLSHRAGHGRGPLSFACAASHMGARASEERSLVIDRLMALGADLLEPDRIGETPLSHLQALPDPSFQRLAERAQLSQRCQSAPSRRPGPCL